MWWTGGNDIGHKHPVGRWVSSMGCDVSQRCDIWLCKEWHPRLSTRVCIFSWCPQSRSNFDLWYNVVPPSDKLVYTPINQFDISTISPSSYRTGAPLCIWILGHIRHISILRYSYRYPKFVDSESLRRTKIGGSPGLRCSPICSRSISMGGSDHHSGINQVWVKRVKTSQW
jgi:hypothetical protein